VTVQRVVTMSSGALTQDDVFLLIGSVTATTTVVTCPTNATALGQVMRYITSQHLEQFACWYRFFVTFGFY